MAHRWNFCLRRNRGHKLNWRDINGKLRTLNIYNPRQHCVITIITRCSISLNLTSQGHRHRGHGRGAHDPFTFSRGKKKNGKQRKKRKSLKAETIKCCQQGQNVTILALPERPEFKMFFLSAIYGGQQYFSVFNGPTKIHFAGPTVGKLLQSRVGNNYIYVGKNGVRCTAMTSNWVQS